MNLTFMTPFGVTGYGICGAYMLEAMYRNGIRPTLFPIGPPNGEPNQMRLYSASVHGPNRCYDPSAPMLRNYHEWEMQFPPGKGKKIAWPFFEVDKLRAEAVAQLNELDAIACGSEWIKNVMEENSVRIHKFILHQGVDTTVFRPDKWRRQDKEYRFFTLGKFEVRKGHYELIEAFKRAFPSEQDVRLFMLCDNPFLKPEAVAAEIIRVSSRDPRISLIERCQTHVQVAQMINACDCGVFPTRGEGWGLPILECLACGKPMACTFVTSQTEFIDSSVAMEIKTLGLEPAHDGRFFFGGGNWYRPDVDSVAECMRKAYDEKMRENPAGVERAAQFTWDASAWSLMKELGWAVPRV